MLNITYILLLTFLPLYVFGCGEKEVPDKFSMEEIELFSQLLDSIEIKSFNDSLYEWENPTLVSDSTYFKVPKPWLIDMLKRDSKDDEYLMKKLIEYNKKKYFFDKKDFKKYKGLEIFSKTEARNFYRRESKIGLGIGFYAYSFSRPYIDESGNRAILFSREFSEDWEEGLYIIYKKENGKWITERKINPDNLP